MDILRLASFLTVKTSTAKNWLALGCVKRVFSRLRSSSHLDQKIGHLPRDYLTSSVDIQCSFSDITSA